MSINKPKVNLFAIFIIAFLELFGFGLIIPVLPIIFKSDTASIIDASITTDRNVLYAYLLGLTSLFQFIGAPILGAYSDKIGRKKALLILFVVNAIGAFIFTYGIISKSLVILFLGRLVPAIFGNSLMILQIIIADFSANEDKAKNFGLLGVAFGLGFIFGPLTGGIISSSDISSYFSLHLPFIIAGFLTLINAILMWNIIPETLLKSADKPVSLLSGFYNLKKAFSTEKVKHMYWVIFFLTIGFALFTQFFPIFLEEKFSFGQKWIGYSLAFLGIWVAISQGFVLRRLSKRLNSYQMLQYALPVFAISYLLIVIPDTWQNVWIMIIPFTIFQGLTFPNTLAILSNLADDSIQGETIGINQSVQSFAYGIPPLVAGFAISLNIHFPNWFGFVATLIAFVIYVRAFGFKSKSKSKQEN